MHRGLLLGSILAFTLSCTAETTARKEPPPRPRVATQKLMPPPWQRTPGGTKPVKPAPIARGSPR